MFRRIGNVSNYATVTTDAQVHPRLRTAQSARIVLSGAPKPDAAQRAVRARGSRHYQRDEAAMAEITIGDLLTWEPRLSFYRDDAGVDAGQLGTDSEREVTWVVTVRASQPVLPPLRGGELVIVPERTVEDTEVPLQELLREVVTRGATGIIFDHPLETPDGLVRLLVDPIPVDLESEINRLLTERRGAIYRAGTDLGRVLQQANALGADVERVLEAAADYLAMNALVVDAAGEPVAVAALQDGAVPQLPPLSQARSWAAGWYGIRLTGGDALWLGPVPDEQRALARVVAERLAVAVEAALAHAHDVRPRGGARSIALAGLFSAAATDSSRVAASLGLPVNGTYRIALCSSLEDRLAAQHELARYGPVHDASEFGGYPATLIEVRGQWRPRESDPGKRAATQPGTAEPVRGHWVAVSGPVTGAGHIPEAARQARFVAALIEQEAIAGELLRFDRVSEVGVYRLLYPLWGSAELETFVSDALGRLLTDDRRGTLRATLLAFLESGGSHVDAAARLGVHRNTLSYRLRQIERSLGADLDRPSPRLALHMALLASTLPPAP